MDNKTIKRLECPNCKILSERLVNNFDCEYCGHFQKKEWKKRVNSDGIELIWGIIGFGLLIAIIMVFISPALRKVATWMLIAIPLVGSVAITLIINFIRIRPDKHKPFLKKIEAKQQAWKTNKMAIVDPLFAKSKSTELRCSILPYYRQNKEKLLSIATTDPNDEVRMTTVKMITDRELLLHILKQDNNVWVIRYLISYLKLTPEEKVNIITTDYPIFTKSEVIELISDKETIESLLNGYPEKETKKLLNEQLKSVIRKGLEKEAQHLNNKYGRTLRELSKLDVSKISEASVNNVVSELELLRLMSKGNLNDYIDSYRSNSTKVVKLVSTNSTIEDDGYHIHSRWMEIHKLGENQYIHSSYSTDRLD